MPTKVKGTTGVDKIEAGAVITNPSFSGNATVTGTLTVDSTASINGSNLPQQFGFRNLIINGDMRIHQRGGTITAASATVYYGLDRFWGYAGTGQFSMEQSTDAPDNFLNSMKVTVTTVDSSMAAGDRYMLSQPIEGLNVTNLDFGSSTAQTVTLSFWVKSSITGTFGAVLINGNATRTYVKEYTINSANTWEKKTITIAGDTSGTWTYTNALWGSVRFCLAAGSTYYGTDSTWNAGNYISTSNQTNLMATSGATFYITGVQLEVGSGASDFEHLPYDVQLARCQRYYIQYNQDKQIYGHISIGGLAASTTECRHALAFPTTMRTVPSVSHNALLVQDGVTITAVTSVNTVGNQTSRESGFVLCNVASGLTQYRPYQLQANNNVNGYLAFSAEL